MIGEPGGRDPLPLTRARRWPLLSNRDFMLLSGGEVLSEIGSQAAAVAYPLLVLALTGSAAKAGIVGLAKWLPLAVFSLPAGALADRVNRKVLMIGCDAIRMAAVGSVVIALVVGRPPYLQILLAAFLDGGLYTTSFIAERGAIRQMVPNDHLHDAITQNEARSFAAGIIGPSLGGALFSIGRAVPFIAQGASFLASMTAISMTRSQFQTDTTREPFSWRTLAAELSAGFAWLREHPLFLACTSLATLSNPVFTGITLLAILVARHHGASSTETGAMLTLVGVGGVIGAILAPAIRRRLTFRAIVVGVRWMMLVAIVPLFVVHNALLIGAVIAIAELGTPVGNAVLSAARIAAAPDHLQSRVQATSVALAMSLAWLGPLAVGAIFQAAGSAVTIATLGAWTLVTSLIATGIPQLRDTPDLAPGS